MAERPGGLPVFALVGSAFCVVLTFLALQVRAGQDPVIGAGAAAERRPVVVRRVIVRRLVEPAARAAAASTPEIAAPAPEVAAPAPAPEPAPVTTQAS